jgi:hypothetical protein
MSARIMLAGLALLLAACSSKNLPDYVKLGELRVLGLVADKPEVNTGTTVTLTPLLSDLNGKGRALTYSAEACNDPGLGYGAQPSCDGAPSRLALATDVPVTGLTAPNYTAAATSTLAVTVPASAFTGRSALDQANGVAYLVLFHLRAADGASVDAFKRLIVSTRAAAELNLNPQLTSVQANGGPFLSAPGASTTLQPVFGAVGAESYLVLQADGSTRAQSETLTTTWFISDGTVDYFRTEGTGATTYTPPDTPPTGRSTVFVVVSRDERGGEASLFYSF